MHNHLSQPNNPHLCASPSSSYSSPHNISPSSWLNLITPSSFYTPTFTTPILSSKITARTASGRTTPSSSSTAGHPRVDHNPRQLSPLLHRRAMPPSAAPRALLHLCLAPWDRRRAPPSSVVDGLLPPWVSSSLFPSLCKSERAHMCVFFVCVSVCVLHVWLYMLCK